MGIWTKKRQTINLWLRSIVKDPNIFDYHGLKVTLPNSISDGVKYSVMRGRYEFNEATLVKKYLKAGDNVLELGGSIGLVSSVIRSQIGRDARHIIVEADSNIISVLTKNAGSFTNTFVENLLITDTVLSKTKLFYRGHSTLSGSSLENTEAAAGFVQVSTVGELIRKFDLKKFALICDIEGAEVEVFRNFEAERWEGCVLIIAELHPKLIKRYDLELEEFLRWVSDLGFTLVEKQQNVFVWRKTKNENAS